NMRIFLLWFLVSVSLVAQQPPGRGAGPAPAYKNLKLLAANSDVAFIMGSFNEALGVQCTYCHQEGDFAAEGNPKKDVARKMIVLVRQINANFTGTGVFPVGPQVVTCYTCHRGDTHPVSWSNRRYDPPAARP